MNVSADINRRVYILHQRYFKSIEQFLFIAVHFDHPYPLQAFDSTPFPLSLPKATNGHSEG